MDRFSNVEFSLVLQRMIEMFSKDPSINFEEFRCYANLFAYQYIRSLDVDLASRRIFELKCDFDLNALNQQIRSNETGKISGAHLTLVECLSELISLKELVGKIELNEDVVPDNVKHEDVIPDDVKHKFLKNLWRLSQSMELIEIFYPPLSNSARHVLRHAMLMLETCIVSEDLKRFMDDCYGNFELSCDCINEDSLISQFKMAIASLLHLNEQLPEPTFSNFTQLYNQNSFFKILSLINSGDWARIEELERKFRNDEEIQRLFGVNLGIIPPYSEKGSIRFKPSSQNSDVYVCGNSDERLINSKMNTRLDFQATSRKNQQTLRVLSEEEILEPTYEENLTSNEDERPQDQNLSSVIPKLIILSEADGNKPEVEDERTPSFPNAILNPTKNVLPNELDNEPAQLLSNLSSSRGDKMLPLSLKDCSNSRAANETGLREISQLPLCDIRRQTQFDKTRENDGASNKETFSLSYILSTSDPQHTFRDKRTRLLLSKFSSQMSSTGFNLVETNNKNPSKAGENHSQDDTWAIGSKEGVSKSTRGNELPGRSAKKLGDRLPNYENNVREQTARNKINEVSHSNGSDDSLIFTSSQPRATYPLGDSYDSNNTPSIAYGLIAQYEEELSLDSFDSEIMGAIPNLCDIESYGEGSHASEEIVHTTPKKDDSRHSGSQWTKDSPGSLESVCASPIRTNEEVNRGAPLADNAPLDQLSSQRASNSNQRIDLSLPSSSSSSIGSLGSTQIPFSRTRLFNPKANPKSMDHPDKKIMKNVPKTTKGLPSKIARKDSPRNSDQGRAIERFDSDIISTIAVTTSNTLKSPAVINHTPELKTKTKTKLRKRKFTLNLSNSSSSDEELSKEAFAKKQLETTSRLSRKRLIAIRRNKPQINNQPAALQNNEPQINNQPNAIESNKPQLNNQADTLKSNKSQINKQPDSIKGNKAQLNNQPDVIKINKQPINYQLNVIESKKPRLFRQEDRCLRGAPVSNPQTNKIIETASTRLTSSEDDIHENVRNRRKRAIIIESSESDSEINFNGRNSKSSSNSDNTLPIDNNIKLRDKRGIKSSSECSTDYLSDETLPIKRMVSTVISEDKDSSYSEANAKLHPVKTDLDVNDSSSCISDSDDDECMVQDKESSKRNKRVEPSKWLSKKGKNHGAKNKKYQNRRPWSHREEKLLCMGMEKYGKSHWKRIATKYGIQRSSQQLYDKWRNLCKKNGWIF